MDKIIKIDLAYKIGFYKIIKAKWPTFLRDWFPDEKTPNFSQIWKPLRNIEPDPNNKIIETARFLTRPGAISQILYGLQWTVQ